VPDSKTVSAVLRKSAQVFGTVAPAFSKAVVLYQIIDLWRPLAVDTVLRAVRRAEFLPAGEKFLLSELCASVRAV